MSNYLNVLRRYSIKIFNINRHRINKLLASELPPILVFAHIHSFFYQDVKMKIAQCSPIECVPIYFIIKRNKSKHFVSMNVE